MKCSHCTVPSPKICQNEFNDQLPNHPVNPYRLKIFPARSPEPPNAWCEAETPSLGDYTGCHRTGGKAMVIGRYVDTTSPIYPTFLEMLNDLE